MKATKGSQKWLQIGVNECPAILDDAIRSSMRLPADATIDWRSPRASEDFVEYRDQAFIAKLGLTLPKRSLVEFWPPRGPVWDGLARTSTDEILLIEAKAHIPEMVSPASKASTASLTLIKRGLEETRSALAPRTTDSWSGTFYQYTNRLAHLYFLRTINGINARLLFLYFINAIDVGGPTSQLEWAGAIKVTEAYLGIGRHKLSPYIHHVFVDVNRYPKG